MFARRFVLLLAAFGIVLLPVAVSHAEVADSGLLAGKGVAACMAQTEQEKGSDRKVPAFAVSAAPPAPAQSKELFGEHSTVVLISAGALLVILIAAIVAFVIVRGNRKCGNRKRSSRKKGQDAVSADRKGRTFTDRVKTNGGENAAGSAPGADDGSLCVRLCDANNPARIWNYPLSDTIMIGRDADCQVRISEESVSRQQCKLYLANHVLVAENVSGVNITQLNGEPLRSPRPVREGDRLKCGRITLMVDAVYGLGSGRSGDLNKMTRFLDV